jgi:uncharacterized membrane protein
MTGRGVALGIYAYALAGIAFGVIGLVWGDFARVWQPVQALPFTLPGTQVLAYVVAVALLLGGAGLLWPRTARIGAVVLGAVYLVFALFWLPRVIGFPRMVGTWSGFGEQFALVIAAAVLYVSSAPRKPASSATALRVARILFGLCVLVFGAAHFSALSETANLVPKWMPLGGQFWAMATGVAFELAGISIRTGLLSVLGARLLTAMLLVFGAFVWLPVLFVNPGVHTVWAGNAINLAVAAAAWVIADSIASSE